MKKKLMLTMAVVMILSVMLTSGAFAATRYVYGSCDGFSCYGKVECIDRSGKATTSFSGPSTTLSVRIQYTWKDGYGYVRTIDRYTSNSSTSLTLVQGGSVGVNTFGEFSVEHGMDFWHATKSVSNN